MSLSPPKRKGQLAGCLRREILPFLLHLPAEYRNFNSFRTELTRPDHIPSVTAEIRGRCSDASLRPLFDMEVHSRSNKLEPKV